MMIYTIQSGDTLMKVARKFYHDANSFGVIVTANNLLDPHRLKVGQQLIIPDVVATSPHVNSEPATPAHAVSLNGIESIARRDEERLSHLHPVLAIRARCILELCRHAGIGASVTQGFRAWEDQDHLYATGRTVPPLGKQHIVTYAKGGQSYHNFGLAFDIVVLDADGKANWDPDHPSWRRVGDIGKSVGLAWGGDWKALKDLPHFEYSCGLSLKVCRGLYASGLASIWSEII